MPIFIVETVADSPIREFWQIEAGSHQEARAMFSDSHCGKFLWDEVTGDETNRDISEVHTFADLASTIALHNAQQEAPAMLAALRALLHQCEYIASESPEAMQHPDLLSARAILARIDGAAPAPTAPAPVAAPGFAAHALDTLKDCEAWFANGGDVDGVFFDDATMLDRVRESLALATPTAQPAGAIGEAGGDEPQKPVCRSCGGDSVVIDGAARWNMAGQDWGLSGTYDDSAYCDDCEDETKLNWVAVAPDELAAANLSGPTLIAAAREAEALAGEA